MLGKRVLLLDRVVFFVRRVADNDIESTVPQNAFEFKTPVKGLVTLLPLLESQLITGVDPILPRERAIKLHTGRLLTIYYPCFIRFIRSIAGDVSNQRIAGIDIAVNAGEAFDILYLFDMR